MTDWLRPEDQGRNGFNSRNNGGTTDLHAAVFRALAAAAAAAAAVLATMSLVAELEYVTETLKKLGS